MLSTYFLMFEEVEKKKQKMGYLTERYSPDQNIDQILSSLSHELRTPLSILSSNLQLLKHKDELDEDVRIETFQLFEEALASVTYFLNQIHFLNLSNKGELKKQSKTFNIEQLIEKVLSQPNTSFRNSNRIKIESNLQDENFCSDEALVSHILTGLLDNAFKFSIKEVNLHIFNNGNELEFIIEDQGVGIPGNEIDQVFKPFYRCENVKMINGTGLGLSIVKRSIDCLGGIISVESIVSKGTKFKLKIPADEC